MVKNGIRVVAVIPARGGSKRIPQKNIKNFCGKPMIAWTIQAALNVEVIDSVYVSTDDEEIARISREYGAEVPFLRDKYADDHSTISEATVYTLKKLGYRRGDNDLVIQLMANCPVRDSEDINYSIDYFLERKNEFQISCCKYGWMNPWWAHKRDERGNMEPIFKSEQGKRSQDQMELYCPTGAVWVSKVSNLLKYGTFYGPGYDFCEINWKSAVDIDDYHDLELAKCIKNMINE